MRFSTFCYDGQHSGGRGNPSCNGRNPEQGATKQYRMKSRGTVHEYETVPLRKYFVMDASLQTLHRFFLYLSVCAVAKRHAALRLRDRQLELLGLIHLHHLLLDLLADSLRHLVLSAVV